MLHWARPVAPSADGFSPERTCAMIPLTVPGTSEKVPASNSDNTILFADDDGSYQELVAKLLYKCGYHVILARDGNDAIQKAREFDGVIQLLLSDVEMPGMTGIELAIQINKERPDTKILLISGLPAGMLVLNNGWQFLPKPFVSDMLRDRIRDFLIEQPSIKDHLPDTGTSEIPEVRPGGKEEAFCSGPEDKNGSK
jgi:CheY-like chemotaxis protein